MVKVLVVEDDLKIRKNIARLLTFEDYEVLTADNGVEGLQRALTARPDLILCDILMPEMNGYEMFQQLRTQAPDYFAPFIFVTAKGAKDDLRQGMSLGADDYLTKPFTRVELLAAVQTRLAKHQTFLTHYQTQVDKLEAEYSEPQMFDATTGLPTLDYLAEQFQVLVYEYENARFGQPQDSVLLPIMLLRLTSLAGLSQELMPDRQMTLWQRITAQVDQRCGDRHSLVGLGDGEFVVLVPLQSDRQAIEAIAIDLLQLFEQTFTVETQGYRWRAEIGISIYCRDGHSVRELIQKSRQAIATLPNSLDTPYRFYAAQNKLGLTAQKQTLIASELHHAIERSQITVHYQPIVSLHSGKILSVEALARWEHPEFGLVNSFDFIAIAEQTNLIQPIGFYVLDQAVKDVKQWQQHQPDLRLAVNFSSHQLKHHNICHEIVRILLGVDFAPAQLDIEVTEASLHHDLKVMLKRLTALQRLGCHVTLDDFGAGYSSLNCAQLLPWNTLKLDRCFVMNLPDQSIQQTIVKNVINIASELGFQVIAEGLETPQELALLQQYGCHQGQGYLLAKPRPASAFTPQFFQSSLLVP